MYSNTSQHKTLMRSFTDCKKKKQKKRKKKSKAIKQIEM